MKFKLICLLVFPVLVYSQTSKQTIDNFLENAAKTEKFNISDVSDLSLDSQHFSNSLKADLIYMQQNFNGIPIYNAIGSFAIRNSQVVSFKHNFKSEISQKVTQNSVSLSPIEATNSAIDNLNIQANTNLTKIITAESSREFTLESAEASNEDILVKLVFVEHNQQLILAWDITLYEKSTTHWWSIRVDANTGKPISTNDWLLSCNFEKHEHSKKQQATIKNTSVLLDNTFNTGSYNAYPIPVESPNHGSRNLISNPNSNASPFGWHDVDGVAGAEFTITRGNNVYAQEDRDANDGFGYAPDGDSSLNFDFDIDFSLPPSFYEDAAITNLFVWNNLIHDVWYNYGFDEEAGNFQQTNYNGDLISGNDFVIADAQDGAGLNNANFGTPPDGFNPRMQMFLWSPPGQPDPPLTINNPVSLAGDYNGGLAVFGGDIPLNPISSDLVIAKDSESSTEIYDACETITNTSELANKIVVIRRGSCPFVSKIQKAQDAGAIAVIMVNNVLGDPINMGGQSSTITIPSIMLSLSEGEAIISAIENNTTVNATLVNSGPYNLDGDFDNGIIAHEYGHGISNRLTGGKLQSNCLFNEDQMGEGWSDWIGLMMTIEPGDLPSDGRGIGTFAVSQSINGNGIRPFRYSTDNGINPSTYNLTNNPGISLPHGIGFVWSTMLWDLTWAFIDQYGFDQDLFNGDGGNNKVMQLVIDGMKLQTCEPGFIDGRDAILQADLLANNGENQCLIWDVFAARGLGYSATQGNSNNRFDQNEAFDTPPLSVLSCALSATSYQNRQLILYPNPTQTSFKISLNNIPFDKAELKIYGINGQLVKETQFSQNNNLINVDELKPGVYIIKTQINQTSFTKKLIIN